MFLTFLKQTTKVSVPFLWMLISFIVFNLKMPVEYIWLFIKNIIHAGMNLFIPKVRIRKHQYPFWYTPELRHLSKCLLTLRRKISKCAYATALQHANLKLSQWEENFFSIKSSLLKPLMNPNSSTLLQESAINSKIYDYI